MKVRVIKDFKPKSASGWIRAGEEFEVRFFENHARLSRCDFQIISGPRSGDVIPIECGIHLPEEKTYTESERANIVKRYEEANQENLMHRENVAELTRQRDMFEDTCKVLQKQLDEQKPVIPREVSDAIEYYSAPGYLTKFGILDCILTESTNLAAIARKALFKKFGESDGNEILMQAIVNDYTVEQTLEDRVKDGVREIVQKWYAEPSAPTEEEDRSLLASRITSFVQAVYAKG